MAGARRPAAPRRLAGEPARDEPGRELPRLADGRVLALDAVRGLAGPPFLPLPLRPPFLPLPLPLPLRPLLPLAGLRAAADWLISLAGRAWLLLAEVLRDRGLAAGLLAADFAMVRLAEVRLPDIWLAVRLADDLPVGRLAEVLLADRPVVVRRAGASRDPLDRFGAAARRAGAAGMAGLAEDSVFAAEVSALAAVVIAFVAAFTDCMAVDSVRAEDVALVAADVILVAADVTLVAADDTVRAAVAEVGRADDVRVLRRAVVRAVVRVVVRLPVRVDLVALRADDVEPDDRDGRDAALVVGRLAERFAPLVLVDRVLAERAGVRRAAARAVVCTGTDFPPS